MKYPTLSHTGLKSIITMTLAVLVIAPGFIPTPVRAESGIIAHAVKGITQMLSIGKSEEVMATDIQPASFPISEDKTPKRTIVAVMTAYSSDPNQTDDTPCIPADWRYNLCEMYEKYGEQDTIAANFLPMGTKVRFPDLYGDKVFTVRDRMNARYGEGRGDIWMPTYTEAKNFGLKRVKMEIFTK